MDDASTVMGTGKKKSKQQNSEERMKTINVQILIPEVGFQVHGLNNIPSLNNVFNFSA